MSLSGKAVLNMLQDQETFDRNDVGFMLTVIRDDMTSPASQAIVQEYLSALSKNSNKKGK